MSDNKYYVYVHKYASGPKSGQVFYVGKGAYKDRCKSKSGRNLYWNRIVSKYGYTHSVVIRFSEEICAFSFERALIKLYGRENLCNLTDGGEGTSGRIVSESQRLKCSNSNKGKKPSQKTMRLAVKKNSKPVGTTCGLVFISASEAARTLLSEVDFRTAKTCISACCNGRKVSNAFGYEFRFIVDGKLVDPGFKKKELGKPVKTECGLMFSSATSASEWLKGNGWPKAINSNITQNCKGNVMSAYGYKWSYA